MIILSISGMTCASCTYPIQEALVAIAGVSNANVSYNEANAIIETDTEIHEKTLCDAVEALGYTAKVVVPDNTTGLTKDKNAEELHVAIIGSGSGAFACAIKAAEGGAKVTLIEGSDVIGGCCVNVGCVPSKILIRAAQLAEQQRHNPFSGLENHAPQLNRALLAQQQTARVEELRAAKYQNILEANPAFSLLKGWAKFKNSNTLLVRKNDGTEQEVHADKILIATGSTPTIPSIDGLAETPYWTSTEALFAQELPQHLIVIGSSLARHTLLYRDDPLLGEKLTECFEKEGIQVLNNTQATKVTYHGSQFTVDTNAEVLRCDRLLVSTGRHANTKSLLMNAWKRMFTVFTPLETVVTCHNSSMSPQPPVAVQVSI